MRWLSFIIGVCLLVGVMGKKYKMPDSCKIGRPACIASCQIQNAATGYCVYRERVKREICVCSRFGDGHGL